MANIKSKKLYENVVYLVFNFSFTTLCLIIVLTGFPFLSFLFLLICIVVHYGIFAFSLDMCVQDRREYLSCMDNPVFRNVPTESKFVPYFPLCPSGDNSCAFDSAYIRVQNPEWYRKLFGDVEPEEAMRECLRQTGQMPEEKVYFVSRRLRITEEGGVYTIYDPSTAG